MHVNQHKRLTCFDFAYGAKYDAVSSTHSDLVRFTVRIAAVIQEASVVPTILGVYNRVLYVTTQTLRLASHLIVNQKQNQNSDSL